jgi:hypothetical protein
MAVQIVELAWSGDISEEADSVAFGAHAIGSGNPPLAREYAKYKNRPFRFQLRATI